ncbi:Succinate dehydrogenase subunit 5, mitochondrial [Linum grandiflorum]
MSKMLTLRSLCQAASLRSSMNLAAITTNHLLHHLTAPRSLFTLSSAANRLPSGCQAAFTNGVGSTRAFSVDVAHLPEVKDPDVLCAFKDLMAASWDELDVTAVHDVKNALSKSSDDKPGQQVLENVFRASQAVEEFGGMIMTLKMELDDSIGMSGEVLRM